MAKMKRGKVSDFTPDPKNANAGTMRGLRLLEDSLRESGAGRSLLADKNGVLLAGNKTAERAVDIGLENAVIVETDGTEVVIVKRTDLDINTPEGRAMAYRDNRVGELSLSWQPEQLIADMQAGLFPEGLFDTAELEALIAAVKDDPPDDPGAQVDKAAELQVKWQTERGQVWQIGKHRLMCGDSTSREDVATLLGGSMPLFVWGDPPYGIALDRDTANRRKGYYGGTAIDEDNAPWDENLLTDWISLWAEFLSPAGYLASWCPYQGIGAVEKAALGTGMLWLNLFTWIKENPSPGFPEYLWKSCEHSPIFRKPGKGRYIGRGLVRDYAITPVTPQSERSGDHPSPKRLDVIIPIIDKLTPPSGIIADPFLGSGTTMVAAEQTGRICYGMEIEPKYCAVTLERLTQMGLTPVLHKYEAA